ncbi:MAG: alanine racemase [Gemmatimonadaceae bacterium]|nr:alanine racemase [Gemmatimonadaceae bacterium]
MNPDPLSLESLETPALLVDLGRLDANIAKTADYAAAHDLALRPHVKTHKSVRVAAEQLRRGAMGLTCATPFEAEVMSAVCDDLLVAFPPVGASRAARLAALPVAARLIVALDSARAVRDMSTAATTAGREVGVYVELDLGMHRVGVPVLDEAILLARLVKGTPSLYLAGLAFYPGHVREHASAQDEPLRALDAALGEALARFADAGIDPPVVSGGSTPTLWRSHELRGITEIRPGTYVYNDRTAVATGSCTWEECAATVLATVVSTAVHGQAVIDAGSKALGREPVRGAAGEGFGQLLEHPEVVVSRMSEEHGMLELNGTSWKPRVGDRVRVVPNHACIVVHLNDMVVGVRGDRVETTWPVDARGRGHRGIGLQTLPRPSGVPIVP